jgi:serine/threonine protein phosphatase 1
MATIAVGDIHGNLSALEDLLAKLIPVLSPDDVVVFLGDYIDRGPDARGCLEQILRFRAECQCAVVTLLGNHEDWLLKTMRDHTFHSWILGMEAFETVASYSTNAAVILREELERVGAELISQKVALNYDVFFEQVPLEHLKFFNTLELYYRSDDVVCVHGGVDPAGSPLHLQNSDTLLWGPDNFPDAYRGRDAIVYGHWDNAFDDESGWPLPCIKDNRTFGIDTISRGVLTAMRFPDGEIFQSKKYPSSNRKF